MTKNEFIKKAKDLGYTDEEIKDYVEMVEHDTQDGLFIPWESVLLIEKPVY